MIYATANEAASIRIEMPDYLPAYNRGLTAQYIETMKRISKYVALPSDTKQESDIFEMHPISAAWFSAVEQRIRRSAAPQGQGIEVDERWLTQDIADAASSFFVAASDVLPAEPYIYKSRKGDLVAEYSSVHGTLTNIVSQNFVVSFAVVDGVPIEMRHELTPDSLGTLRQDLQQLTTKLRTGRYDAQVEPRN